MLTINATNRSVMLTGVRTNGRPVLNRYIEITDAPTSDPADVIADVAKEARHLPARLGGEDFGEMYTWVKMFDHLPSVIARLGTHEYAAT